jgi:hypothetical protein
MVEVSSNTWATLGSTSDANIQLRNDGVYIYNNASAWESHAVRIAIAKFS